MPSHHSCILTINTGSSSLKAALYRMDGGEQRMLAMLAATVERIGRPDSHIRIADASGSGLLDRTEDLADHGAALRALLDWMKDVGYARRVEAVGHRVVHGGTAYSEPQPVTDDLIVTLRALVPIDPNHLPQAIEAIEATRAVFPDTPQVACFDTAFHRHMPRVAQIYALPRRYQEMGILRYGFHGLSYEYIMGELRRIDPDAASGRVLFAHLGNGASMAAVRAGTGIDTTMGFTPTGGLVMGTRPGDLDPNIPLYLIESQHMSPEEVGRLVNAQSGLLGVSETSPDMHDLLAAEATDPRAAEAVELFCYTARKFVGALAAALGGLDTLVFTGGIGEHAAPVRERICSGLDFLGIELERQRNVEASAIISGDNSRVVVRVIRTDEDVTIARHTIHVLEALGDSHVHIRG
jgi:acetate kinase